MKDRLTHEFETTEPPRPGRLVDLDAAAACCRVLIDAYVNDPQDVDWSDVQGALAHALEACGLPPDYPEQQYAARIAKQDANMDRYPDYAVYRKAKQEIGEEPMTFVEWLGCEADQAAAGALS